jgi:hypothetical protein
MKPFKELEEEQGRTTLRTTGGTSTAGMGVLVLNGLETLLTLSTKLMFWPRFLVSSFGEVSLGRQALAREFVRDIGMEAANIGPRETTV